MHDDLAQVYLAIEERDVKCRDDLRDVETKVAKNEILKNEMTKGVLGTAERKEVTRIEGMREHAAALKRHMENTSGYLKKEMKAVETKIQEAKALMLKNVGVNIDEYDTLLE
jgi:hypothetical protein